MAMLKSDLINNLFVTQQLNLRRSDVVLAVQTIIDSLIESLASGRRIEIRGVGSFNLNYRNARIAHNPKTGIKVAVKGKYVVSYKAGKSLCERVDSARKRGLEIKD